MDRFIDKACPGDWLYNRYLKSSMDRFIDSNQLADEQSKLLFKIQYG